MNGPLPVSSQMPTEGREGNIAGIVDLPSLPQLLACAMRGLQTLQATAVTGRLRIAHLTCNGAMWFKACVHYASMSCPIARAYQNSHVSQETAARVCRLEHVAAATNRSDTLYVGHSQGTTLALAALSESATARQHIKGAALLAPVAFVQHTESTMLRTLADLHTERCALPFAAGYLILKLLQAVSARLSLCKSRAHSAQLACLRSAIFHVHAVLLTTGKACYCGVLLQTSFERASNASSQRLYEQAWQRRVIEEFGLHSFLPSEVDETLVFPQARSAQCVACQETLRTPEHKACG